MSEHSLKEGMEAAFSDQNDQESPAMAPLHLRGLLTPMQSECKILLIWEHFASALALALHSCK